MNDALVWVTDDVALLAVREGSYQEPINPLWPCDGNCLAYDMVSGLSNDGTTAVSSTDGWTTNDPAYSFNSGSLTTMKYQTGTSPCSALDGNDDPLSLSFPRIVCVEQ